MGVVGGWGGCYILSEHILAGPQIFKGLFEGSNLALGLGLELG